jgi:molecular chaperone DnaJ
MMGMSSKRDYYEVLGISKTAAPNEIKSQYRKLALKFHPDRNKSEEAAEHFKEISEAYAVLSDPEKKNLYDQYGHSGVDGKYSTDDIFRGASGNFDDVFSDLFGRGGGEGFQSIFETLLGRGGGFGGFRKQKGSDLLYETSITLEDVLNGKHMEIDLNKDVECSSCNGSGAADSSSVKTCKTCNGQGQTRQTRKMGFASFMTVGMCNACHGQGKIIEKPCKNCKGRGITQGIRHLPFDIPAGIDTGDYTIPGEGESVSDGINGDLIVRIRVKPHPKFKRDGGDIFYDKQISVIDASLGQTLEVPTLDGIEKINVEQGSQPNTIIKLKGKGVPRLNSRGRGDQYVRLVVNIPKNLNKNQKNLLKEFEKTLNSDKNN